MPVTREEAIQIMKDRGYTFTSESGNGSWIGFSKDMDGIWISSHVYLESASIELFGGILKMNCELKVNKFDFFHKRFDEFEKWCYFYAKVCGEIEKVVTDLDFIPARVYMANTKLPTVGEPEPEKKATLEDRMKKFKKRIIAIGKDKEYPSKMCQQFFNYWSEVNDNGRKMRFEIAKSKGGVFNIERRLSTWASKDQEYNARFADRDEKKAKKQNEEVKVVKKANTKELF